MLARQVLTTAPGQSQSDVSNPWSTGEMLALLAAAVAGGSVAVLMLPVWLPQISYTLMGTTPRVFWYLGRSSAFVAFGLLWFSMLLGLMMTNKLARAWPGGPTTMTLHQNTSLLGLGFAVFHALILN